ncbi:MAG: type VI secretion system tip protein VgrG [Planctomycetes bacterium]|nr:type VI secretion system tip protein VgrG [Planctomycetota bacterium]
MATYTQDTRFASFECSLGADALLLRWMRGSELVSGLSRFEVGLQSERRDIDAHEMVGKGATVMVETANGEKRHLHGIVTRFSLGSRDSRLTEYQAELHPWLWLLTRRSNCRIFQNLSVPQIVEKVFRDAGCPDFEFKLRASYDPRVYCVQYRETDFAFVSRLLEEVGIFYFVRHEPDRHVVVLVDGTSSLPECEGQPEADFQGNVGQVGRDVVTEWTSSQQLHPGRVTLKDYNFEDPGNPLRVSRSTEDAIGDNSGHEVYDYQPEKYATAGAGDPIALVRMQEQESHGVLVAAAGTCRAFSAGHTFRLRKHFRAEVDGKRFLLVSVEHELTQPSALFTGANADTRSSYENRFTCVPAELPFRPQRVTPKPFVRGPQTAVVVGPAGEEIHVDKYGRIKVQFHWDREGRKDDQSSCWIRVSQAWAGKQWGAMVHPRIGDEVIVECLEGDPDKPIVTGCVYNAQQMPPYALPANKTQSGLKSRSSPGGSAANFNEIRFEDKKGQEELFIQAEKNKTVHVKNNRAETVGANETISIGHDRTESVGHDESITIGNNRTETVGVDESISIGANRTETVGANESITIGANRSETVGGSESVSIATARTHSIGVNDMVNVGAAQQIVVGAAQAVAVGAARTTSIGANDSLTVGRRLTIDAGDQIEIKTGDASILMKKDGTITIKGKDITITGSGKITAKATGDMTLKGSKVAQN